MNYLNIDHIDHIYFVEDKNEDDDDGNEQQRKEKEFEDKVQVLEEYLYWWIRTFDRAHKPKFITPYIHAFVCHVPEFIRLYKDLNRFNLQGLEKLNHITIIAFQRNTNKHLTLNAFVKQLIQKMNRREFFLLDENLEE